jgi:two-component system response regulator HydG
VNVRLISATHRDLEKAIADKEFRMDLYQRLNVVTLRVPPLRERREDIPALATHFMKTLAAQNGKKCYSIAEPVWRVMMTYDWPGNVRELRNFIETMVIFDVDGVLGTDDVPPESKVLQKGPATASGGGLAAGGAALVGKPLSEVERYYVEEALKLTGNNREEAAKLLDVGERTIYRKIQEWKQGDRIKQALDESGGDVAAAAKALETSEAELRKEMKRLGMAAE